MAGAGGGAEEGEVILVIIGPNAAKPLIKVQRSITSFMDQLYAKKSLCFGSI